MSKIITKKQLNLVIESTIKEATDYMNEAEIKLTKQHMDDLHKNGHCMCDDKCLIYYEDIKGDEKKMSELLTKLSSEKMDCVVISKQQMDMLHKDGKCECDNNLTLSYEDSMNEGDYMKEGEMCSECGSGTMMEGTCNECGYSMNMGEDEIKNPGKYMGGERQKAGIDDDGDGVPNKADKDPKDGNVTEIKVGDKTYKVVDESINELTESLMKTTNNKLLKEEKDFFNKIINYKK
jgi:hypothetical protein